jgi:hypothetical protein
MEATDRNSREYTLQFDKENNRAKRERKNDGEKYILRAAESLRLLTAHRRFVIIYIRINKYGGIRYGKDDVCVERPEADFSGTAVELYGV